MGYIYKILCNLTGECYYGKSKGGYNRFINHTCKSNTCSSKQIIERGNYQFIIVEDNIDILLLRDKEYYYITNFKCINNTIPYVVQDNKAKRHREEEKKRYYNNQEFYKKKSNELYYKNHDKIRMDRNSKIKCVCGLEYSKGNKMRHYRSNFHKNKVNEEKEEKEVNEEKESTA